MSRSAAARTQHDGERALRRPRPIRSHGAAHARRISGPVHPARSPQAQAQARTQMHVPAYAPPRTRMSRPPLRLAAGGAAIALRVAESASASRTMDRLVRSRAWVVIIGVGLIGIVAMQVSMLKLNAGIGRAVDTVATLERSNASLKGEVSRLSSADRIQALAGQQGFVMPEPADVTYLRAGDKRSDGLRAARRMGGADPAITGPAGAVWAPDPAAALTATPDGLVAAAATGATATAPATAPATQTMAPAAPSASNPSNPSTATRPPASTAPTTTPTNPSATTAPSSNGTTAAVTPAPAAPQTTSAGGVTLP
jgi:hypothetical protein